MDIVERLRGNADEQLSGWQIVAIMHEAADEIERLHEDKLIALAAVESENAFYQEEIERLREALKRIAENNDGLDVWSFAEATLKEGE